MKAQPQCLICLLQQALNTAKVVSDNREVHRRVLDRLGETIPEVTLDQAPADLSNAAYRTVNEVTGIEDPYYEMKRVNNKEALSVYEDIKAAVLDSFDPLEAAVHAAVAGNIIDLGIDHEFDIETDILPVLDIPFAINDYPEFVKELQNADHILYLGDNAGEIVFDKLLVEQLADRGVEVTFSVKSGPVINDAMMEDAREAGIGEVAEVIETGSDHIGVNWEAISGEFMSKVEAADLIVSKGQGNFETCSGRPENFYFILKAKCEIVAEELGVELGDIVFKKSDF